MASPLRLKSRVAATLSRPRRGKKGKRTAQQPRETQEISGLRQDPAAAPTCVWGGGAQSASKPSAQDSVTCWQCQPHAHTKPLQERTGLT